MRRTGMSEAILKDVMEAARRGDEPYDGMTKRTRSGPVNIDTGAMVPTSSDDSHVESLARPPPPYLPNHTSDMVVYNENPEHLSRIVSFGEGHHGYVDEEAARKYTATAADRRRRNRSSSRVVKFLMLLALFLLVISVVSVAVAIFPPKEGERRSESSAKSTEVNSGTNEKPIGDNSIIGLNPGQNDLGTFEPTAEPSYFPSTVRPTHSPLPLASCEQGAQCFVEGSSCSNLNLRVSCCGKTFDTFDCDCVNMGGKLQYLCYYTPYACAAGPYSQKHTQKHMKHIKFISCDDDEIEDR